MSNYRISRMYLDNYKLFICRELDFTDCSLAVFDGPNGFGKTSVFDAIEFLLTDNIKRVAENPSILKNEAYETVFIAGNPKKDVIIKAEFLSDTDGPLVIAKVIPAVHKVKKGRKNNPTKLSELAYSYILPSFETNDYNDLNRCDHSQIISKLGTNIITFFDLFYYIKQEDRLDFLKKTEKDRMTGINRLFNMEKEKIDLDNAIKAVRQLNKLDKDLDGFITNIENDIKNIEGTLQNSVANNVKYEKLLFWKKETEIWDEHIIQISNINKKDEIIKVIKEIQIFIENYNEFLNQQRNKWCSGWLEKQAYFKYFLLLLPYKDTLEIIKIINKSLKNLKQQMQLFSDGNYVNINFKMLSDILNIDINLPLINEIISQIIEYDKSSNSLAKAASEINQTREILRNKASGLCGAGPTDGHCTLCGYDWGSRDALINQIEKTSTLFKNITDESTLHKEEKIRELKKIYVDKILPEINAYLSINKTIDNDQFNFIFDPKNKIEEAFNTFINGCNLYNFNIDKYKSDYINIDINDKLVQELINDLSTLIKTLSNEYITAAEKIEFSDIFNRYFDGNKNYINNITIEKIQNKIAYIEFNYYNTTFEKIESLRKEFTNYENKKKILAEEIIPQTTQYRDIVKSCIEKYQNQIIKNIEIPFYIYSGRIMQSYQGGLGILIKESENDGKETENDLGLNSIRFVSPSRQEHDIIYTLSSGQLSAVIISFTLALNKIYSENSFKCIFIDDPVQTMDELNIASFVELIRNEFRDRQIILSTHEDSFSRYIRYKYSKYGLKASAITLKNR